MAFFDFLKDANSEKKAVKKGFNFLINTDKKIVNTAKDVGSDVVRSIPRGAVTIGGELGTRISGEPVGKYVYTPSNRFDKAILGDEPVESIKGRGEAFGVHGAGGAALGLGLTGLDVVPGVPGKKKGVETVYQQLAKADKVEDIRKIMKGTPERYIKKVEGALTQTKDPNVVRNIIDKNIPVSSEVPISRLTSYEGAPDKARVAKYKADIEAGKPIEPLRVLPDSKGNLGIEDGKHRFQALQETGATHAPIYGQAPDIVTATKGINPVVRLAETSKTPQEFAEKLKVLPETPEARSLVDNIGAPTAEDLYGAIKSGDIPVETPSPVAKIADALRGKPAAEGQAPIKGVASYIRDDKANLSAVRAERLAKAQAAGAGKVGEEQLAAELGALKGEIPRIDATNLHEHLQATIAPTDIEELGRLIDASPSLQGYDKLAARKSLSRLYYDGKVPTNSEWKKLGKVMGPELEQVVKETDSLYSRGTDIARKIVGTPKALLSSYDISGMGRQGAPLGARFPQEFAESFKSQITFMASQDTYDDAMREIGQRKNADLYEKAGLAITGVKDMRREEAFPESLAESDWAKKLLVGKGVDATQRAYTGSLTKFRADVFDTIIDNLERTGFKINQKKTFGIKHGGEVTHDINNIPIKELKDLANYVNAFSGRGDLGKLEKYAQALGDGLFSPRLWKSRLDMLNPVYYAKLSGPAKKLAMQNASSFAGIAAVVLGLAVAAGADVETDARSSDFLKIKVGDTRYDILGGFQQNLVAAHRMLPGTFDFLPTDVGKGQRTYIGSGEKKSSTTGAIQKLGEDFGGPTRLTVLADLVQNKAAPVPGFALRLIDGQDRAGQPLSAKTEVANMFVPLSMQETASQVDAYGPMGFLTSLPGYVGAGAQTYGLKDTNLSEKEKEVVDKVSEPNKKAAVKEFYQIAKTAGGRKKNVSSEIKEAIKDGDIERAKSLAQEYNSQYSAQFTSWRSSNENLRQEKKLTDAYKKNLITEDSFKRWIKANKKGEL